MQQAVITLPSDFSPQQDWLFLARGNGKNVEVNYKLVGGITIKKTKEEQIAHRRAYRKKYSRRPHVIAKTRKRLEDPDKKAKRKEYANRESVKKRKQELAALGRSVRRKMKEEMPEVYFKLVSEVLQGPPIHLEEMESSNEELAEERVFKFDPSLSQSFDYQLSRTNGLTQEERENETSEHWKAMREQWEKEYPEMDTEIRFTNPSATSYISEGARREGVRGWKAQLAKEQQICGNC